MALDNANFIAELSITDPPGSDPLSQGDDQIRTIKRATFQSFPLVAAAVNLTDVQLNLAAIKNEVNAFTGSLNQFLDRALTIKQSVNSVRGDLVWLAEDNFESWTLGRGPTTSLGNWELRRFDSLGNLLDAPFQVDSQLGVVNFEKPPTVDGAPIWLAGEVRMFAVGGQTPGSNWFLADGTNGTVNMLDRFTVGTNISAAGTLLAPNFDGLAAASTVGLTAITEAQMPAHVHQHGMTQTDQLSADTTNIEDQSAGTVADDPTRPFHVITEPTGGGAGHNHTQQQVGVTENGTARDTVRPLSVVVEYHQYVP